VPTSGRPLSLALVAIDHFKRINDHHSHAVGDEALKAVARALQASAREADTVARWGGEEFAVLLPDTVLETARAAAERLRQAVEAIDCSAFAPGLRLAVSIGLASDAGFGHHERLLSRADAALYRAKQEGRNRVCGEGQTTS
jgi:diguanylate cyclase (GGDEF)-like protein